MRKRLLSLLLAFMMVVTVLPGMSSTVYAETYSGQVDASNLVAGDILEPGASINTSGLTVALQSGGSCIKNGETYQQNSGTINIGGQDVIEISSEGVITVYGTSLYPYANGKVDNWTVVSVEENSITIAGYAPEPVSYLDADGNEQTCTEYTVVSSSDSYTVWNDGWYVVKGNVTCSNFIYVNSGTVNLILCDGAKLDVGPLRLTGGNLTIYAQSAGNNMGSLKVEAESDNDCGIDTSESSLTIVGGNITAISPAGAISGSVKNAISGTGWTDTAGKQGRNEIAINTSGQSLSSYKKIQFPTAPLDPVSYLDAAGEEQTCSDYTVVTDSTTTFENNKWYVVNNNTTISNRIITDGTVNLILCDGATLTAQEGVAVTGTNSLTIYGQTKGTGTLTATGTYSDAGIGGSGSTNGGTIIINGGTINANGGGDAAGIGDGSTRYSGSSVSVIINGGIVNATSGEGAAGIGGGNSSPDCNVTINGGTVTAISHGNYSYGAGIGTAGWSADGGTITITGGTVNVFGLDSGDNGIGGKNCTINITGGNINVNEDNENAACGLKGGNITISEATVVSNGKNNGIECQTLNITSGNVTTNGDDSFGVSFNEATISGGVLTAEGYYFGIMNDNGSLTINNGSVTANSNYGSGIGNYGNLTINNGSLTAEGNQYGINNYGNVSISDGNMVTSGPNGAINGSVKNAISGTGWTNIAGTEGKANIGISTSGQDFSSYKKVQFPAVHTHDFEYSVSSDGYSIIAKCKADDCDLPDNEVALTISASDASYTGSAYTGATLTNTEAWTSAGLETPVIEYEGRGDTSYTKSTTAPTNAGSYKASITVEGMKATADFEITKAAGTISYETESITKNVDDDPFTNTLSKTGDGTVTYTSVSDVVTVDSGSGMVTINKGGTATITATVEDGTNYTYETKTASYTITVNKKTQSIVAPVAAEDLVYNSQDQGLLSSGATVTTGNTSGVRYKIGENGEWSESDSIPTGKDAGDYAVYYKVLGNDKYEEVAESGPITVSITAKEVGLEWSNTELTYNGESQKPTATATGLAGSDTCTVAVSGEQTNAGDNYTAKADSLSNSNYTLPSEKTTTFTISPKSISGASVTLDKTELTYNGSEQSVSVTGVSLDGKTLTADDYTVSGNTGTNKNDYTVTVTGNGNFKDSATADWKIVAKAMKVSAEPVSKIYDGNEYGITVAVTDPSDGTTVKYGTEKGTYDKDESPKYKDAGTYTVYFKVSGNSNYNEYEGSATVTISKKPVTASISAEDKTYDGKTDAAVNATVKPEDLVSGDSIEITGLTGNFIDANAGEDKKVTVDSSAKTISGTGADNYEVTIPENGKATISKADATVKVKDQSIKVGDAVPDLSNPVLGKDYTVEGLVGGDALTTVPKLEYASKPDNTKPGTYEITASNASAGDNYDLSYQRGTLTISEKPAPVPTSKPVLAAKGIAKGKTAVNLSWNKVSGADRYVIYFARCNQKGRSYVTKKVKTVNGKTLKWSKGKLAKNTAYKFYVVAQKKSGKSYKNIAKSKVGHFYTGNVKGKYTNPKSLTLKKSAYTLKKGKTATIKASVSKVKTNKKLATSHAATYRYTSNNPAVATVNAKGKVTAKAKGTAVIYVQTINGIWKTCKVTVN